MNMRYEYYKNKNKYKDSIIYYRIDKENNNINVLSKSFPKINYWYNIFSNLIRYDDIAKNKTKYNKITEDQRFYMNTYYKTFNNLDSIIYEFYIRKNFF